MDAFFNQPNSGGFLMSMVGFVAAALAFMVWAVAVQWRKVRQADVDGAIKQEMLRRGMSADDIVRVIEAGRIEEALEFKKQQMEEAMDFKRKMLKRGVSAEEIDRVLKAGVPTEKGVPAGPNHV